jgi:amidase
MVGPTLLESGRPGGSLSGVSFAVKDLFDVIGTPTGAGNPDRLADTDVATAHAPTVRMLLEAGADLWGKTVTDELAFSLSGTNVHYGTPINSRAPGRIPGGSSSGSAAAVAGGIVDVSLGTDTGGSVRVPASYCGLVGLRPTHGRVDIKGVVPLAPSFDTVGILARNGVDLARAWRALRVDPYLLARAQGERSIRRLVLVTDLMALVDEEARPVLFSAATALADQLGLEFTETALAKPAALSIWNDAFRSVQLVEAWRSHGAWITRCQPSFGPGVAARFAAAAATDPIAATKAQAERRQILDALRHLMDDDALMLQPTTSGPAPLLEMDPPAKSDLRRRTMTLTAPAGLAGAPVISLPLAHLRDLPLGLSLVGLPGDDEVLVALAEKVMLPS